MRCQPPISVKWAIAFINPVFAAPRFTFSRIQITNPEALEFWGERPDLQLSPGSRSPSAFPRLGSLSASLSPEAEVDSPFAGPQGVPSRFRWTEKCGDSDIALGLNSVGLRRARRQLSPACPDSVTFQVRIRPKSVSGQE
jgi:hypothetical protein